MYFFKEDKRQELLDGRTISYIARELLFVSPSFLCAVLSGRRACSERTARLMMKALNKNLDDYFYEDKSKPYYTKASK